MTSKASFTHAQLVRFAKVAKEMGVTIEVVTKDGTTIRISPATIEQPAAPKKTIRL